jgi:hypothetical protein
MLYRLQGLIFMALGCVSLVEGWHITQVAREGGNFDAVGPDRYLMGVGVALLGLGLWLAINPPQLSKEAEDYRLPADVKTNLIVCLGMLAAFTLALPYTGFTLGCFVFLAVLFKRLGNWSWARSTAAAAISAAVFYLGLVRFADVPLPSGILGL